MSQFIEMFGNPLSEIQKYPIERLGDNCILNPAKPKGIDDDSLVSFIPMQDVSDNSTQNIYTSRPYSEVKKGFTYCADGDVILAKITPCMENGKGAELKGLSNAIGMGSTEFHVIRPINGKTTSTWLYHFTKLDIIRRDAAKNMTGTGGQKRVPVSYFENFKIGIPPIVQQELFASIAHQADKSKVSDFKSQFIEMFGRISTKRIWKDILTIVNGKAFKGEYAQSGTYPICGSAGIMGYGEEKLCPKETVILGRKGNINSPIYMDTDYWIVDTAFCLNVNKEILNPIYFFYWCKLFDFTKYNKQGVLPSLTRLDLERIEMIVPNMELQNQFVEIVKQADKSKSNVQLALEKVNNRLKQLQIAA